jgi:hypothetical protein
MATPAFGALCKLAMGDATDGTIDEPYEFISCDLRKVETILDASEAGIRGTRSRVEERARKGHYDVSGTITMNPSPADLDLLLPRIMGAGAVLTETLPGFDVVVVYGSTDVFRYDDCKVNRGTFRGSAQGLVELELDIIGKTMVDGTDPSLTLPTDAHDAPYIFSDSTCSITSSREIKSFELVIDNFVVPQFVNSQSANNVNATDRQVSLTLVTPYSSDEADLVGAAATSGMFDTARTSATLVFTNGAFSCTFTLAKLQAGQETPSIGDKGEIELTIPAIARRDGSTLELAVVNDSTP